MLQQNSKAIKIITAKDSPTASEVPVGFEDLQKNDDGKEYSNDIEIVKQVD